LFIRSASAKQQEGSKPNLAATNLNRTIIASSSFGGSMTQLTGGYKLQNAPILTSTITSMMRYNLKCKNAKLEGGFAHFKKGITFHEYVLWERLFYCNIERVECSSIRTLSDWDAPELVRRYLLLNRKEKSPIFRA
jgi:hypothetical protein